MADENVETSTENVLEAVTEGILGAVVENTIEVVTEGILDTVTESILDVITKDAPANPNPGNKEKQPRLKVKKSEEKRRKNHLKFVR